MSQSMHGSTTIHIPRKHIVPTHLNLPDQVLTRIEMLWPIDWAPLAEADRANVTAQVLLPDDSGPVPCRWEPRVLLWGSLNGGPSEVVAT